MKTVKTLNMKKILFLIMVLFTTLANAQSKYEAGMGKGFEMLKSAQIAEDMGAASAFFERIADAEKDKWLPYYYAAYANHLTGWMNPKADKDKVAAKSKDLLTKAEVLEKDNAELWVLHQMITVQQLTVDPMTRWQAYGAEAANYIEKAKKADANNPRIYLVEGQFKQNVPEAFGGGKEVGKVLFTKSIELFKTFKPATEMHPSWGKDQAEQMLAALNK